MAEAVQTFRAISWLIFKWLLIAVVGIVMLIAGCVGIYFAHGWYTYDRYAALVAPVIRIDPDLCKTGGYPLFFAFKNDSAKAIDRVSFTIGAKIPGHSTDISNFHTVSSDRIIKAGEGIGSCYSVPKLSQDSLPSTLNWSLKHITYTFAD